jgi:hypothetical protein
VPSDTPVIVFLDVDGVVSATSSRHGFGDGRRARVDGFDLTLSGRLGARLRQLPADIRWLTTWGHQAGEIGARMGLPPLPLAGEPPAAATSSGPWKLEVVRSVVEEEGRAFIWIDDDAITDEADAWLGQTSMRGMFVRPQPNRGLTPADLDAVEAFIEQVRRAP